MCFTEISPSFIELFSEVVHDDSPFYVFTTLAYRVRASNDRVHRAAPYRKGSSKCRRGSGATRVRRFSEQLLPWHRGALILGVTKILPALPHSPFVHLVIESLSSSLSAG